MGFAPRRSSCLGRGIGPNSYKPVDRAGADYPGQKGNEPKPPQRRGRSDKSQRDESQSKTNSDDSINNSFVVLKHDVLRIWCWAIGAHRSFAVHTNAKCLRCEPSPARLDSEGVGLRRGRAGRMRFLVDEVAARNGQAAWWSQISNPTFPNVTLGPNMNDQFLGRGTNCATMRHQCKI